MTTIRELEDEERQILQRKRADKPRHRNLHAGVALVFGDEFRSFSGIELRAGKNADSIIAEGCAIRYSPVVSTITDFMGSFGEEVMPGAATAALNRKDIDVAFQVNHGAGGQLPLARYCPSKGINTLQLDDRQDGLHFRANMSAQSQAANDLAVALSTRSIDQMSYAFTIADGGKDQWSMRGEQEHRIIFSYGSLKDVSPVTKPAEPSTTVSLAERSYVRAAKYVAAVDAEIRAGKTISKATASKVGQALAHLQAANVNLEASHGHLLDLLGDGTTSGNSGPPAGLGSSDGTGSRTLKGLQLEKLQLECYELRQSDAEIRRLLKEIGYEIIDTEED